jgi:hypothetical protein
MTGASSKRNQERSGPHPAHNRSRNSILLFRLVSGKCIPVFIAIIQRYYEKATPKKQKDK